MVFTAFDYRTQEEVERPPELMDIPVLTDVCHLSNLIDSLRPWATREEVDQAIEKLSKADLCKIRKVAELKGWHDWEDLLSEVLLRALMGKRRYDKSIDFVTFLIGSMRGMHSNNKEKSRKLEQLDPAYDLASREKRVDERLQDEADLAERLQLLGDDPEARMLFLDLACGMNKQEIKLKRSLSDRKFAAIMKRIRSKLSGRNDHKGGT
jgi:DNA-directed RNA polymerase specialized sigma24 family protein